MTPERTGQIVRWSIAAVAGIDAIRLALFAATSADPQRIASAPAAIRILSTVPFAAALCAAAVIALLFRFAWRSDAVSGSAAMLLMIVLGETQGIVGPNGAERNFYASGAVLLGYLAGALFPTRSERFAIAGARAMLAGIYVSSAVSKLRASRFEWISAPAIQSTVAALAPVNGWRAGLAGFVVAHASISASLAAAAFALELGAFFLMARGRIRQVWAVLLIAMHASIAVLTSIVYPGNLLLLAAICAAIPPERMEAAAEERAVSGRTIVRFAGVAAAVVAAIVMTVLTTRGTPDRGPIESAMLPPPGACNVSSIGTLAVGTELDGWRVSSIERSPDQALLRIRRASGEVTFVIVPAGPVKRPTPFDRGDISIWYMRTPIPFDSFGPAGIALADAVTAKGQPAENAATLRRWLASPCE